MKMKTTLCIALAMLSIIAMPRLSYSKEFIGRASVIDGDTIEIMGQRFRLQGIDAPESNQSCTKQTGQYRCGQQSALFLADLVEGKTIQCLRTDTDRYQRIVAECYADEMNLNAEMVSSGWAVAYTDYSSAYVEQEAKARKAKVGIWQGQFTKPSDFRKQATMQEQTASRGCIIKGNINGKGQRIYHLPGSSAYGKTRINTANGERWFCSVQEALAAGWRPVRSR